MGDFIKDKLERYIERDRNRDRVRSRETEKGIDREKRRRGGK